MIEMGCQGRGGVGGRCPMLVRFPEDNAKSGEQRLENVFLSSLLRGLCLQSRTLARQTLVRAMSQWGGAFLQTAGRVLYRTCCPSTAEPCHHLPVLLETYE